MNTNTGKTFKSEIELCRPVIQWLQAQHWDVYQEVEIFAQSARADIVAVRGPGIWVIEAKLSLSLSLIEQILWWRYYSHHVSVLVPKRKRRSSGGTLLQRLGIGLMEVSTTWDGSHEVTYKPGRFSRMRPIDTERMLSTLTPALKTGEFGEAGNCNSLRYTPYRHTMSDVKRFLTTNGPSTLKQIIENLEHHYCNDKSAIQSMRKALYEYEDWCHVDMSGGEFLYTNTERRRSQEEV